MDQNHILQRNKRSVLISSEITILLGIILIGEIFIQRQVLGSTVGWYFFAFLIIITAATGLFGIIGVYQESSAIILVQIIAYVISVIIYFLLALYWILILFAWALASSLQHTECNESRDNCDEKINDNSEDYIYIIIAGLYSFLAADFFIIAIIFDYRLRNSLKVNREITYIQLESNRVPRQQ